VAGGQHQRNDGADLEFGGGARGGDGQQREIVQRVSPLPYRCNGIPHEGDTADCDHDNRERIAQPIHVPVECQGDQ